MLSTNQTLGLPRRVVMLYLLFSLGAVGLLTAGSYFAVQSLLAGRTSGSCLAQLGRLSAALKLDRVQTDGQNAQSLVSGALGSGSYAYGAIVDEAGLFVAHTDVELIGKAAIDPPGAEPLSWGSVAGYRYTDATGRTINEYRAPLDAQDRPAQTLYLAVSEPRLSDTFTQYGHYATLAILGPLVCLAVGMWSISRLTSPLADIENQLAALARLPHGETAVPQPTTASGIAALGWNRLIEQRQTAGVEEPEDDLESRLVALTQGMGAGRTRDALESLSEGVALTDPEGRIEFANRAISALLQSPDSLDGASLLDVIHELSPDTEQELRQARCETAVAELQLAEGDDRRVLRVARGPLRSRDNSEGHVWSVRDITQQKLAEASRDQFINTATHELRTPLANIKAYAETLVTCDFSDVEEQKQFCNTINTEATRLARFVDDLLSISSLEVGSLAIDRQRTEVKRLMEEAAEKVGTLMKSKRLRFAVTLGEKLGDAKLDKDKVLGMVVNLLGNAAKYTPEGGEVRFTVDRQEDALRIEVRDSGVGIAEEEQPKVFDKFFRSANPEIREEVGTGLGLPLAREIAELHRGELTLESTLGEGSTFTVTLPIE